MAELLTQKQVFSFPDNTKVYIEFRGNDGYEDGGGVVFDTDAGKKICHVYAGWLWSDDIGVDYRVWSRTPSRKEMYETKWEESE